MTAFGQAIAHELAPQQHMPRQVVPSRTAHSPPHHQQPTQHFCLQFCQHCKRAEQKLITLKSFIKKVYFLLPARRTAAGRGPRRSARPGTGTGTGVPKKAKLTKSKTEPNLEPQGVSCCLLLVSYLLLLCLFLFIWPAHC